MGEFSLVHWLIVIAILLLLFGPSKLPQLGAGIGQGIRNFKKAMKEPESIDVEANVKKTEEKEEKKS
jgi:sec-independent protein translocase protein TatA